MQSIYKFKHFLITAIELWTLKIDAFLYKQIEINSRKSFYTFASLKIIIIKAFDCCFTVHWVLQSSRWRYLSRFFQHAFNMQTISYSLYNSIQQRKKFKLMSRKERQDWEQSYGIYAKSKTRFLENYMTDFD